MSKLKIILVSVFVVGGLTASLLIQDQAEGKLRESDAVLRRQDNQLAALAAEHQRLSNLVAQANSSSAEDQLPELAKLRSQAEAFRKQTNELGKQLASFASLASRFEAGLGLHARYLRCLGGVRLQLGRI
jgi:hypothetical protein